MSVECSFSMTPPPGTSAWKVNASGVSCTSDRADSPVPRRLNLSNFEMFSEDNLGGFRGKTARFRGGRVCVS